MELLGAASDESALGALSFENGKLSSKINLNYLVMNHRKKSSIGEVWEVVGLRSWSDRLIRAI